MMKKLLKLIFIAMVLLASACIKETYDMNKLSEEIKLSPEIGVSAVKGSVTLSDLVDSGDTIVFDQNNLVKIIFREDSVIDLKMEDFYDLNSMVSYSKSYQIGEMNVASFYQSITLSLDYLTGYFSPALRNQFVALDNTTSVFPSFPLTDIGESAFPSITNIESAVFLSGFIELSVRNNLEAPLSGLTIQLYNSAGHVPIGDPAVISTIQPGGLELATIDLADETVTNSVLAAIVITGSPGTSPDAVPISLSEDNIEIGIRGVDLKVKSGRVALPVQTIESLDTRDTIDFDAGEGIELDELKVAAGDLSYLISSDAPIEATVGFSIPTALRSGIELSESLILSPGTQIDGEISLDNTVIDLGADPLQPYNRLPVVYSIIVSSSGSIIDFDWQDSVYFEFELIDPDFDYVKGYFGEQEEAFGPETIDLDIDDILSHLTGDFLISDPSIKLVYYNSFAIPIEIAFNATGQRDDETVDLNLAPFIINSSATIDNREIKDSILIDKDKSSLPELISLLPAEINFSGSASMNPDGNDGERDNYMFGDSRFLGSIEIEVPMEFRMNNLQFTDTLDNFMNEDDGNDDDSPLNPEDFEKMSVSLYVANGFPIGISVKMSLYDSETKTIKNSIDAPDILEAAPVDSNGKASGVAESTTEIEITQAFFDSVNEADKIIFEFTLNTTSNGTQDVKIYSDYSIEFSAALLLKPGINIK